MVALDETTVAALKEHKQRQMLERTLMGDAYEDSDLVFSLQDGSPLHPDSFTGLFQRHAKAANLPRIRFHDLRHTHATLALAAGVHPKVVSERLGHASVTITLDTYSHAIPAMQETAAELVASLVFNHETSSCSPSRGWLSIGGAPICARMMSSGTPCFFMALYRTPTATPPTCALTRLTTE